MRSSAPGYGTRVPWWGHVSARVAPTVLLLLCLHAVVVGSGDHPVGGGPGDLASGAGPWLTPIALSVVGAAHVVTAGGLRPADLTGRWLLAIGGALTVVSGWLPLLGHHGFWHTMVTNLALVTLCVWPALLTPERRQVPAALRRRFGQSLAFVLGALLLLYVCTDPSRTTSAADLQQGLLMTAQSATPLLILLALRRSALPQSAARGVSQGSSSDSSAASDSSGSSDPSEPGSNPAAPREHATSRRS